MKNLKRLAATSLAFCLILAGCSNDSAPDTRAVSGNEPSAPPAALPNSTSQADVASPSTPASLSGNTPHKGPNPHGKLSAEQRIEVALQHADAGRYKEALDVLSRAIEEYPDHPGLLGARGSLLLGENKPSLALADLEKAVKLAPDSALLLVNRSQAYRRFNRLREAMADLDKAVEMSPQLVPARFNRGVLLFGESRYEEALADFDLCITLAPEVAGPYFNRAVTRDAMNDQSGAVSDMNRFLELADNPEWQQAAIDTLEAWKKRDAQVSEQDNM